MITLKCNGFQMDDHVIFTAKDGDQNVASGIFPVSTPDGRPNVRVVKFGNEELEVTVTFTDDDPKKVGTGPQKIRMYWEGTAEVEED